MDEDFEIAVSYKGKELAFPARLRPFGFTYKIEVDVYGTPVYFERDEEREWRALAEPGDMEKSRMDPALIGQLVEALEGIFK